jgi:hypothetical protein
MAERSEAKKREAKLRVEINILILLTRSFALLRSAISAKYKWAINWSLYPQGLNFYRNTF